MDALLWKRIGDLFEAARQLEGEERVEFLREECGADQSLFRRVLSLLDADNIPAIESRPTATALQVPDVVAGRFRIVRYIAEGGMGTVYEAEDLQLQERVALKTIRPEIAFDTKAVERFKREIHLAKTVTHNNVCRVHDLVVDRSEDGSEVLYLSMEYLEGETLASRIARGPLPLAEARPLIENMADALSAAHRADVIHRDFKSGNVILVERHNVKHAVVTDFGLARAVRDSDFKSHTRMAGTVHYMAPEQIRGEEITPATDIYALGVVIYEMVTGQLPFTGDSKITVAMKHLHDQPQPPKTSAPHLDQNWNEAILRCLKKLPGERFQSAGEVKAAIEKGGTPHRGFLQRSVSQPSSARLLIVSLLLLAICVAGIVVLRKRIWPPKPPAEPARIAVLPFDTLGTTADREYLAEGLADEIAGLLSHVRTLQVVSPVSVHGFKTKELPLSEISRQLGARYFVTGSVEGSDSHVRIRVRMLDASTGILWARNYDRDTSNNLSVENEIAQEVVQSLALAIGGEESRALSTPVTQNPQAFDAYLRGKSLVRIFNNRGQETDFAAAEQELQKAIHFDPQMAAAYGELAHLYLLHDFERGRSATHSERLRKAADQALALDPKQIAALDALGMMYLATGGSDAAYRCALQVLALNAHDPGALQLLGSVYGNNGMLEDSLLAFRKAGEAEPLYLYPMTNAAEVLVMLGRLDEAWNENQSAAAIEPDNYSVLLKSAWIRYHQGRYDEAEQIIQSAQPHFASTEQPAANLIRAWIYSRRGSHAEAQALLRQATQSPLVENSMDFQLWLAEGWALEDQPAMSLPILSSVAKMHPNYPWFIRNSNLQSLRGNPEFEKLLAAAKVECERNTARFQKAATLLGQDRKPSSLYSGSACPAAATYSIDSPIPSNPSVFSIRVSAKAAVQNGARLRAVAVRQNV